MAIDTLLLLLLLAAVVILIMRQMRAKSGAGDAEALAELRGQLATLATQSGALQQTVASSMQESEGRLGTRSNSRFATRTTYQPLADRYGGKARGDREGERAYLGSVRAGYRPSEHLVEQAGARLIRRSAAGKSGA